jgi:hypothetical protein
LLSPNYTIYCMSDYIKGNKYPNYKPSTSYSSGRICLQEDCNTVISKYNKYRYCNNHKPKSYPRIKGRQVPDNLQEPKK